VSAGPAAPKDGAARVRLGVIADDLTGATDIAEKVWRAGGTAAVVVGDGWTDPGTGCVVVAQKNRSAPPAEAAAEARAAARVLHTRGFGLIYQKYCSTFDSTPRGNIGPIGDAIAATYDVAVRSIGTPATPSVGRTVRGGRLFVHGVPLDETPMAQHPLTPMTDSRLVELLRPQTARAVVSLSLDALRDGNAGSVVAASTPGGYLLADAVDEHNLDRKPPLVGVGH
jgi:3-dehydrotetronate 4-kinase